MSPGSIRTELVKDLILASRTAEKASNRCIHTKNSFKKTLNVEYAHQVFKILKNYEITEWLYIKGICLHLDANSALVTLKTFFANEQSHFQLTTKQMNIDYHLPI